MWKILYMPFSIVASKISSRLGNNTFQALWTQIDQDNPPPTSKSQDAKTSKAVGAAALQAATFAAVGAAVDRVSRRTFHYLTGAWPGEKKPKPDKAQEQPEA